MVQFITGTHLLNVWQSSLMHNEHFTSSFVNNGVMHNLAHTWPEIVCVLILNFLLEQCAAEVEVTYDPIALCADSVEGQQLLHDIGIKTMALDPQLDYVPWMVVNDVRLKSFITELCPRWVRDYSHITELCPLLGQTFSKLIWRSRSWEHVHERTFMFMRTCYICKLYIHIYIIYIYPLQIFLFLYVW